MQSAMPASDWLVSMSASLQRQWPTIDPTRLDDLALDLWRDERVRALPPDRAAEEWLRPVAVTDRQSGETSAADTSG